MAKRNITIELDDEMIRQVQALDFSISGFTQFAITVLLSEGFSGYTDNLMKRLLLRDLEHIDTEIKSHEHQLVDLNSIREDTVKLLENVEKGMAQLNVAERTSELIGMLNDIIINEKFDPVKIEDVGGVIIRELLGYNPEFDLREHISRVKRVMKHD
jgi:hypothetical protein